LKLAIHHTKGTFSDDWIKYCESSKIPYKLVNCYKDNIVKEIEDCDGLLWHFSHNNPKDYIFAKQLLYSLETAGKKVFPDYKTMWHFDDKVGQKYLLEAVKAPMVPSYVFYSKTDALKWAEGTSFPKVFKLSKGAGSQNVRLVRTKSHAIKLINQAFGKGFSQYEALSNLKERWRKYKLGKTNIKDVGKGVIRLGYTTDFDKTAGKEKGYIYFQDFIPNNDHDIRVIVIDGKAFAIKRMVRENDFRASGSGNILFDKNLFNIDTVKASFDLNDKLNSQCLVIDYVYDNNKNPLIVEISYGFTKEPYYNCPGYWDKNLIWHEGPFNSQHWMVDILTKQLRS
jgi:hypothetical protein